MFWVALNTDSRVIGMIGTSTVSAADMWLKRLFIRPEMKRQGLGGALLAVAEKYAKTKGVVTIHTRFADDYTEAERFYSAKGFCETTRSEDFRHFIKDISGN